LIFSFLIFLYGCIEPFEFQGVDEDNLVVVDGYISNEAKAHTIRLIRTQFFSNYRNEPVNGAFVAIRDDLGGEEILIETSNGYYHTGPDFKAEPDRSYQLEVIISDDEVIVSDPVGLIQGEKPEKIIIEPGAREYYRRDGKLRMEEYVEILVEIPVTSSTEDKFYKWDIHPQWVTQANFAPQEFEWCYIQDHKLTQVSIWQDDISKSKKGIKTVSLGTIPYDHRMWFDLRIRVTQLSLERSGYEFWDDIRTQRGKTGSVFDPIPNSIKGNLRNKMNDDIRVLGHFGVFNVDSLVVHINQDDLPFKDTSPMDCTPILGGRPARCLNCLNYLGGVWNVAIKPDWWDD